MNKENNFKQTQSFPETPGVYIMRGARGAVLYVGKAVNLRRRVASYFARAHEARIEKLVREIVKIDYELTETAIEALIREAALIKLYRPPFNIREKDDKSFLYVEITKDNWPRVILARGTGGTARRRFGPFTSATSLREALKIVRRIFPYSTHTSEELTRHQTAEKGRPCFNYEIGLCPGTCVGSVSRAEYLLTIKNICRFFEGKKAFLIKQSEREMLAASRKLDYEKAEVIKRRIFALQHIRDVAVLSDDPLIPPATSTIPQRIEGYDISNISGTSATGSMVVFRSGQPDKNEYRKFRIQSLTTPDDTGMLREVLTRRFENKWTLPDLILIDGGTPQVNAAKGVLNDFGISIPVVGIAKGPWRDKNEFIGMKPPEELASALIRVRDEAHRFAISYHRKLRAAKSLQ